MGKMLLIFVISVFCGWSIMTYFLTIGAPILGFLASISFGMLTGLILSRFPA